MNKKTMWLFGIFTASMIGLFMIIVQPANADSSSCGECYGKITRLTLKFNGENAGRVVVSQKKNHVVIYDGTVAPGGLLTIKGTEKNGTMGTEIEISVDGSLNTKIHTSCSQPVGPGLVSGDFAVIEAYSLKGGAICPVDALALSLPTVEISPNLAIIMRGDPSELIWTSTNAASASLDNGVGDVDLAGSLTVRPTESTTYTITAVGQDGAASASATVVVLEQASIMVELTADPETILLGETSLLKWDSTNAVSAVIDHGIGDVPPDGFLPVTPGETTLYTITARGPGGETSASATVTVIPPPTVELSLDPSTIRQGEGSLLIWNSANAERIVIDQGVGHVAPAGSLAVNPEATTLYTIKAEGPGGTAGASATLTVIVDDTEVDLAPLSIDLSDAEVDSQSLILSGAIAVEVINHGADPVDREWTLTLFEDLNVDESYDQSEGNMIGSVAVQAGPSAGEQIVVTVEAQTKVFFKGNRIFAFVDSGGVIEETDETNNLIHGMTDCRFTTPVGEFHPTLDWEWTSSPVDETSYQVAHTPAVANLNDDNGDGRIDQGDVPDIIFISHIESQCQIDGTLRAISGDGSGELFSVTSPGTLPTCAPAVGDIDNDGLMEILVLEEYNDSARENARMLAFENDGALKWTSESFFISQIIGHGVSITDLDADGEPEIVFGRNVVNSDGSTRWIGEGSTGHGHSIAADVNLDGLPEIVAGNTVYDGNGEIVWRNDSISGNGFSAAANFDDDPYPEIVVVSAGYVYMLEHTGEITWGPVDLPTPGTRNSLLAWHIKFPFALKIIYTFS